LHLFYQLSSPKFVFAVWNFVWSLKFYYNNNFCQSLLLKSCEIRLFYCKLNSRKRGNLLSVFHRNSLKYRNDQRGKLDWNWLKFYSGRNTGLRAITAPSYKQPSKLSQPQNTQLNLLTYLHELTYLFTWIYFPCHFKVNRDKLAFTNRQWKCKKGKRLTITTNFRSKICET